MDGWFVRDDDGHVQRWKVSKLRELAADLTPFDVELSEISQLREVCWLKDGGAPPTLGEVALYARDIFRADLAYPIILSEDGRVMDGRHRLAKAYALGHDHISAVQFETNPPPDEGASEVRRERPPSPRASREAPEPRSDEHRQRAADGTAAPEIPPGWAEHLPSLAPRETNRMPKLGRFLRAWDNRDAVLNLVLVDYFTTDFGNIKSNERLDQYNGHSLTRWHPQFESIIESGMRPLVRILVDQFDWITYTSCRGHRYRDSEIPPSPRQVGLIPRSPRELKSMLSVLGRAGSKVNRHRRGGSVGIVTETCVLESDDGDRISVELVFQRQGACGWDPYFSEIEDVTAALVHELVLAFQDQALGLSSDHDREQDR